MSLSNEVNIFHYFFSKSISNYFKVYSFFCQSTTNETTLLNGCIDNKHTNDSPEHTDAKAVLDTTPNADQRDQTSAPPVPAAASNLISAATNLGAASNLVAVASNLAAAASNLMPEKSPSNSTAHSRQGSQASTTSTSEMKVNLDVFYYYYYSGPPPLMSFPYPSLMFK